MSPLGYRDNPGWTDMSEYAVHFTKPSLTEDAYRVVMSILWDGTIRPGNNPLGAARYVSEVRDSQRSACFSEIPLDLLQRRIQRRSLYGIGFHQDFLVAKSGARVWYLDNEGEVAGRFQVLVNQRSFFGVDVDDPLWKLTPFVDFPGTYGTSRYEFEWEREWRVPGGLQFAPDDVAFLFIPEQYHDAARGFFEEHEYDHTGPAYLCPYVDPTWGMNRIQQALTILP
jgi:hypothetical protein